MDVVAKNCAIPNAVVNAVAKESCDTLSIVTKNCAACQCCHEESCDTLDVAAKNHVIP